MDGAQVGAPAIDQAVVIMECLACTVRLAILKHSPEPKTVTASNQGGGADSPALQSMAKEASRAMHSPYVEFLQGVAQESGRACVCMWHHGTGLYCSEPARARGARRGSLRANPRKGEGL